MRVFLYGVALCALAGGLWTHDWRLIVASASLAAVWPLIRVDVEAVAHEALLDELWGPDDEEWAE